MGEQQVGLPCTSKDSSADLNDHPGFLLGINRLDKQLARLQMDYYSLCGFLYRHGLSEHKFCDSCDFLYEDNKIVQSAEHHLLSCPLYKHQRKQLFRTVNNSLDFAPSYNHLDITHLLRPTRNKLAVNIGIAGAIYDFVATTAGGPNNFL